MQRGREAKKADARRTRAARVEAWRAWNKRSAQRYLRHRQGELSAEKLREQNRRDPMPLLPSDNDFKIVDGRMEDDNE